MDNKSVRLVLLSFVALFLELVCIRWASAHVLYLGYFTNFVLLGCLLGLGGGALLSHKDSKLIAWLPVVLFFFFAFILLSRAQVTPGFGNFIFFTSNIAEFQLPAYVLLPVIFIFSAAIFTLLAQDLGKLLNEFNPLRAYTLNILGSLGGIALFTLMSALSLPPWTWLILANIVLVLLLPRDATFKRNIAFLVGIVLLLGISDFKAGNIWSPYYRIGLYQPQGNTGFHPVKSNEVTHGLPLIVTVNGIMHQASTKLADSDEIYALPYSVFKEKPVYDEVLIIGAGGGNDVAFALANGAKHIDAVEIDPKIAELGQRFHPENPYSDPRVALRVNDGRAFLHSSKTKYDLVIYALTDSLVLATNASNLRLESYLFTIESFADVKAHLKPDGLFILYNYYRYDWLVSKINAMVFTVFGEQPANYRSAPSMNFTQRGFSVIFTGPKAQSIDTTQPGFVTEPAETLQPATDNWPFLYLKTPSIPNLYLFTLVLIIVFSSLYIWYLIPQKTITQNPWPFFFMGAAFTLLETKSIVQFLLLFGATWLVNSLVFFGVLLSVLLAIWVVAKFNFKRLEILYALLFGALLLNFALPLNTLLIENMAMRFLVAVAVLFSPIFIANLIYSTLFRDTKQTNVAYAANLFGTVIGGITEYLSLVTGYQALILVAGIFYLLAFATGYMTTNKERLTSSQIG